jgi:hypothetical protein
MECSSEDLENLKWDKERSQLLLLALEKAANQWIYRISQQMHQPNRIQTEEQIHQPENLIELGHQKIRHRNRFRMLQQAPLLWSKLTLWILSRLSLQARTGALRNQRRLRADFPRTRKVKKRNSKSHCLWNQPPRMEMGHQASLVASLRRTPARKSRKCHLKPNPLQKFLRARSKGSQMMMERSTPKLSSFNQVLRARRVCLQEIIKKMMRMKTTHLQGSRYSSNS